ncbi:MAG: hypothetical protein MJZ61_00895, partial [Bacteroidales bacterium]|nr:hypothetical protein [Bacteroidales bacterium]
SGGMENQTVSFINNANLDLMIHELAHQWFGNMITCGSWHDIFLSEGFATYCEMLAAEKEIVESQDPQQWRTAMINMACSNPHGTVYVANDKSHHEIFNYSTTYAKGAMVVHTLRKELGDQVFFRCIKSYISNPLNKYKNTSIKDLFRAIRIISGRNLDWFTQQWIYGSGYPQYHIIWQQNYDGLIDMQINQTVSDTSVSFFRGKIPLMLHGYNGEKTYYVFNNNSPRQHITINPKINVKYIEFDPYKDVLQIGSTVEQAKFANNAVSIKKEPSGNLKVSFPEDYSFDWYIIRSANNSSIKFRQPIGGMHRFEISTSELPEGQYILIMEGSEYYSTTINVSKKRSKNGHGG